MVAASKLHKYRVTRWTAEWPYCSFAILWSYTQMQDVLFIIHHTHFSYYSLLHGHRFCFEINVTINYMNSFSGSFQLPLLIRLCHGDLNRITSASFWNFNNDNIISYGITLVDTWLLYLCQFITWVCVSNIQNWWILFIFRIKVIPKICIIEYTCNLKFNCIFQIFVE